MRTANSRQEDGFTLIELLVVMALFSLVSVSIYSVLIASVRSGDATTSLTNLSEEARAGFNRMVRDAREAERITEVTQPVANGPVTSFTVDIDFDGDGVTDETEIFSYDDARDRITLSTPGEPAEVLMEGVVPVSGRPVFELTSNLLEYDTDGDGVTQWDEIDGAVGASPNRAGLIDEQELFYLTNVRFVLGIEGSEGQVSRSSEFLAEAQLRNARGDISAVATPTP